MDDSFFSDIKETLRDRSEWEVKQETWFRMRYSGIKRASKPYPNAPDMHYPLVDNMIEKLKPYYVSQLYGQERLCAFVSGQPQSEAMSLLAEQLFDRVIKQMTNFERCMHTNIDYMLQYSRGPIKTYWDADKKAIRFVPIRPIYIIVPSHTEELQCADWLVHVIHMSEAQYRNSGKPYNKDDSFVKSILGRGTEQYQNATDEVMRREGITIGQNEKQIVLWETYKKSGDQWVVETVSPMQPNEKVRDDYGLPYPHGEIPICDLRYELADTDYYSVRGVTEILSQRELSLCKLWNHKLQFLDFSGTPTYENSGGQIPNAVNFKAIPGRILPQGITQSKANPAPMDFKEEMQLERALAEDRVQVPDLSLGEHLAGNKGAKGGTTATQVNAIVGQSGQGNDMRGRIFRLQLGPIYKQAWSLINKYLPQEMRVLEDYSQVPPEAMHDSYDIRPSGSAESYNKEARVNKALMYKQTFTGSPNIKQNELDKYVLEQDDASLVRRLYQEIPDVDKQLLATTGQWVEAELKMGRPIAPDVAKLILQQSSIIIQKLQGNQDQQGLELAKQLAPLQPILQQIAQSDPGQAPAQGGQAEKKPVSVSVSAKLSDFAPSERQQIVAKDYEIQPADPAEIAQQAQQDAALKVAMRPQPKPTP